MVNIEETYNFTKSLAKKIGKELMRKVNNVRIVQYKDTRDICTNVDVWVEKRIIYQILDKYPDHNIFSEELGKIKGNSDYTWIIDPIDGTKHYYRNIPLFTVSIALEYKNQIIMGVVYDPSSDRIYSAYKNGGAYMNSTRLYVSNTSQIKEAFTYVDLAKMNQLDNIDFLISLQKLNKIIHNTYRIRAIGLGSLGMCYLAQGGYDCFIDLTGKVKYYDIAAGSIIVQEAGGQIFDLEGNNINEKSKYFIGSNALLKNKILDMVTGIET